MKKNKSVIGIIVISVVLSIVIGCSGEKSSFSSVQKNKSENSESLPKFIIGSNYYKPYCYVDKDGKTKGVDVDIATEACRRMGYEPVFENINWNRKYEYLNGGMVQCLWGSFEINESGDRYQWVGPYMKKRQVVMVKDSGLIRSPDDLEGARIAVLAGTVEEKIFLDNSDSMLPQIGRLYCLSSVEEMYASIRKGYVDAIAGWESEIKNIFQENPDEFRILDENIYEAGVGVTFKKGTYTEFAENLSDILKEMDNDGTIGDILKKYGLDHNKNLVEK